MIFTSQLKKLALDKDLSASAKPIGYLLCVDEEKGFFVQKVAEQNSTDWKISFGPDIENAKKFSKKEKAEKFNKKICAGVCEVKVAFVDDSKYFVV